jgi:hypothetical protein
MKRDLLKWERIKKAGMAPGARASFSLMAHRGRALLFGGVSDNEARVRSIYISTGIYNL